MKCNECGNVGPCPQCEPEKFAGCAGDTIPREVADRLLRCLSFFATTIKAGERWSETCEREYDQALAEYRKAVPDAR